MVAIRLRRAGSKKRPFFRVVVTDSRAARDSSFVEILGHYNPRTKPAIVDVDRERMDYWLKKGAQPSDTVRTLIARHFNPAAKPAPKTSPAAAAAPPEDPHRSETIIMQRPPAVDPHEAKTVVLPPRPAGTK
ncbi:MAG TPA: 30S ribosomal protein S16 [Vicinamibacterales bacterium]|jgi:small subunit ribosomal protein S16|nr:30S ribosomal protein S16 [Vicinamibacterales bacterium]